MARTLERTLGFRDLLLIVVGTVIGSGIFIVPATVLRQTGGALGPALLVWLVAGVLSLLGALTYGELGAAKPEAGGLYAYIRDAFGPLPAFLYGWTTFFVIGAGSVATLAVAFTSYLRQLVPLGPTAARVVAVGLIVLIAVVNVRGTRQSASVQNWSTGLKAVAILVMSVALLAGGGGLSRDVPMWPATVTPGLLSGVGLAMIGVLWAYEGWQYVTFSAGEARDPQRTFPRAIVAGTGLLIGLYMIANVGYVAALGVEGAQNTDRVAATAVAALFGPAAGKLIAAVILVSMFSAANGLTLTAPRLYYAMARDGVFFRKLAEVHPRYGTPAFAIVAGSAWAALLAATGTFEQLLTYVVFSGWIFYGLGAVSIFAFRRREPDAVRPFRVPGYPVTPALFVAAAAAIVLNAIFTQPGRVLVGLAAVAAGVPAYLVWRARARAVAVAAVLALLAALPPVARAGAQLPAPAVAADTGFVRYTAMIPMRDGVRLNTEIFVPRRAAGKLPVLLTRTPYGVGPNVVLATQPGRALHELARDGYVFVAQDIRGRYRSEGQFVMQRAPRDPKVKGAGARGESAAGGSRAVDEASDAYDTVDWLVRHVPGTNGRVGIFGVSYAGWTAAMALLDPHPALRAASPQASPADMYLGDDFHHNGAFRLSYGFEYAAMMETSKENEQFAFDTYDTYDWYLKLGPLANANARHLKGKIPTWNDFVAHPDYDAFWQRQTIVRYLTKPLTVPTLNVAGWWDQEDFFGPFAIYQALEKQDRHDRNFLVVGPWNHGGWNRADGRTLGKIDFGAPTALHFRERIQAPFFRCHLHGRCDGPQSEAIVFESGANDWRTYDAWPPKTAVSRRALYFGPNGTLTWTAPGSASADTASSRRASSGTASADTAMAYDEFVSDPSKPVPYRPRPIEATYDPRGSGWGAWQVEDQRFVHGRPDVLSWVTEPLAEDVTIAGDVIAELFASTTGSDADWVVKLIDVYPDLDEANPKMSGYQLMVSGEVFRARYRNSFERPEPVVPGQVTPYRVGLHGQAYRFRRGHRIMVQVQSSWFPVIDRNPQTFVPNIFEARAEDFRAAAHRVFRSPDMPSHLTLPVKEPFRP